MFGIDVVGFGPIGRDLASRLVTEKQLRSMFSVSSISDSSGKIYPRNRTEVLKIVEGKKVGRKISDFESRKESRSKSSIVIDVTNSDYTKHEEARKRAISALSQGKHFVSANKVALAYYFSNIMDYAKRKKLKIGYGAAICGGVHAIKIAGSIKEDEIQSAEAVLNASTTMILSTMEENSSLKFDDACKKAADTGVLESDWSIDLDGIDAAAKTSILANVVFPRRKISFNDIVRRGIRDQKAQEMIKTRRTSEERVRLVSKITSDKVVVEPRIVSRDSPLAVYGRFNVVSFETKSLGKISVSNLGGGVSLTASVIISDLWKVIQ